jgi:Rieske Fe-S protein
LPALGKETHRWSGQVMETIDFMSFTPDATPATNTSTSTPAVPSGKLFLKSAMCTHLGCHVHWNSLERCWDCPCHGSHLAVDGTALNSPAISPLADVAMPKSAAKPLAAAE